MATVAEVMNRDVLAVDPTASIGEAAEKMIEGGVGAVVVMEDGVRLIGIITERDLLRAVAQRARAAEARVRQWMTESVITIEPDTPIQDAAQMMFERNFRHLPVSKDGRLLGIVSLRRLSQYEFEQSKESVGTGLIRVRRVIRLFPNRGGWLEVVCGPMFSGKSEELIRRLRRAEIAGQRVLIVKPRIDNRYDIAHVVSHAGARMRAVAVDDPADIPGLVDGYDVVGVDEVQFFPPQITLVLDGLVEGGMRDHRVRARPGLPRPPVRRDAGAPLPRRARRQAAGRLPPLRRAGDDDAAPRRRRARRRRRRHDRGRGARAVRGALPLVPRTAAPVGLPPARRAGLTPAGSRASRPRRRPSRRAA